MKPKVVIPKMQLLASHAPNACMTVAVVHINLQGDPTRKIGKTLRM